MNKNQQYGYKSGIELHKCFLIVETTIRQYELKKKNFNKYLDDRQQFPLYKSRSEEYYRLQNHFIDGIYCTITVDLLDTTLSM